MVGSTRRRLGIYPFGPTTTALDLSDSNSFFTDLLGSESSGPIHPSYQRQILSLITFPSCSPPHVASYFLQGCRDSFGRLWRLQCPSFPPAHDTSTPDPALSAVRLAVPSSSLQSLLGCLRTLQGHLESCPTPSVHPPPPQGLAQASPLGQGCSILTLSFTYFHTLVTNWPSIPDGSLSLRIKVPISGFVQQPWQTRSVS